MILIKENHIAMAGSIQKAVDKAKKHSPKFKIEVETASIISPDRTVLIPDLDAGCSLADSITVDQLREWKADVPEAVVVSYINTTAAIKAESDYCCTSSNAVQIVESIPEDK